MPSIPLIADPELIAELISQPNSERRFIILDVGKDSIYQQAHLPGAVHINYLQLQAGTPPAAGLPPATASLEALLSGVGLTPDTLDRKSTRLNSSHVRISYAVFCLKKKIQTKAENATERRRTCAR